MCTRVSADTGIYNNFMNYGNYEKACLIFGCVVYNVILFKFLRKEEIS